MSGDLRKALELIEALKDRLRESVAATETAEAKLAEVQSDLERVKKQLHEYSRKMVDAADEIISLKETPKDGMKCCDGCLPNHQCHPSDCADWVAEMCPNGCKPKDGE